MINKINVYSNIKNVNRALQNVIYKIKSQKTVLIKSAAADYKILLQSNIMSEKYAEASWEYSPSYKEFKERVAPNQPYWKLSNDLFNSISNTGSSNERFVGIQAGKRNKKGFEIAKYAIKMEYGGDKQQPRPVFEPTLDEYFNGQFQAKIDSSIIEIISMWRV